MGGFLFFTVWLICVWGACVIAADKGRSVIGALIGSLVSGPLALLIAIGLPANRKGVEERLLKSGDYVRCRACQAPIVKDCMRCRYCAIDQPVISSGATVTPEPKSKSPWPGQA